MRSLGLYIHIPFCKAKCIYCDFYSLPRAEGQMDAYVSALTAQLAAWRERTADCTVDTVYFGGGTPSYLGPDRLCRLLDAVFQSYRVAPSAEITLEANPDSAQDISALRQLHDAGFDRLSLGMQSADDAELRRIGRVYQDPARGTCPSMTILENMSMADTKGRPFNLRPCVNRRKTDEYRAMLAQLGLGLEDKMGVMVGSLSGGQRQAMALLMSTMTPIEFLILDEHTAALDPKTAEIIMQLTGRIVAEKHLTTIMVTHNLRYAVEYGDRVLMMHQGHAELDLSGEARRSLRVEDLLKRFNEISIECGN